MVRITRLSAANGGAQPDDHDNVMATSHRPRRAPYPRHNCQNDGLGNVEVHIGSEPNPAIYLFSEAQLCAASRLFQYRFDPANGHDEAVSKFCYFNNNNQDPHKDMAKPEMMRQIEYWIRNQTLREPNGPPQVWFGDLDNYDGISHEMYVRLWKLADYFQIPTLQNHIMRKFYNTWPQGPQRYDLLPLVPIIFTGQATELQKWLVWLYALGVATFENHMGQPGWEWRVRDIASKDTRNQPTDFLGKVFVVQAELLRTIGGPLRGPIQPFIVVPIHLNFFLV